MPLPDIIARRERGVALVLTLGIMALVTLLLIAFVTSMRVENMASKNFNDAIKARLLAQAAVDEAVALLEFNTTNSAYYVTQPGRAANTGPGSYLETLLRSVDSGSLPTNVYLNSDGSIIPLNTDYTTPNVATIVAHWVPVIYTNPATPGTGTIVGRYAYWVDDEAAKVNINSAKQRVNALGPTPSDIDLRALIGPLNPGDISIYQLSHGGAFMTPAEWNLVPNAFASALYSNNSFYVTTYSADTNLTPWGAAKLNLNDPGIAGLGSTLPYERTNAVAAITNMLASVGLTNWFGQTFMAKYNVLQIAANIVDYINTGKTPTDSSSSGATDTGLPLYLGLKPTPYLNELVVTNIVTAQNIGFGTNVYTYTWSTSVELWNMYPADYTPPAPMDVLLQGMPVFSNSFSTGASPAGFTANLSWDITSFGSTIVLHNSYPVQSVSGSLVYTNIFAPTPAPDPGPLASFSILLPSANGVTAIYRSSQGRVDYAIIPMTNQPTTPFPTLAPLGPPSTLTYVFDSACNDPRVKPISSNWVVVAVPPGPTTLGAANPPSVLNLTFGNGTTLVGDGDMSSHTNVNPSPGGISSVGELGYIHTGVPWRTLMLQPQPAVEGSAIPDWAVLDLFTTTNSAVTGRININAQMIIQQGGLGTLNPRIRPLTALIGPSSPLPAVAAANIYSLVFKNPSSFSPVMTWPNTAWQSFSTNAFALEGEICEISGVSDSTVGSTDAQREDGVRSIIDMVTIRSNTFTVWAVGQALKATPTGVIVTGEARVQAVVQRDFTGQFRILYFRYY